MNRLTETFIGCPYCGERVSVLVDTSVTQQRYVEDCEVCCRPMVLAVSADADARVLVEASTEN